MYEVLKVKSLVVHLSKLILAEIEVKINPGLNIFEINGSSTKTTKACKERIKNAIKSSGFKFPSGHISINIHENNNKNFIAFDLAIAVAVLILTKQIQLNLDKILFVAFLSFDGNLESSGNIYTILSLFIKQKIYHNDFKNYYLILPKIILPQKLFPPKLCENIYFIDKLSNINKLSIYESADDKYSYTQFVQEKQEKKRQYTGLIPLIYFKTNPLVLKSLKIACAGMHPLLFTGSLGSGKTQLMLNSINVIPKLKVPQSSINYLNLIAQNFITEDLTINIYDELYEKASHFQGYFFHPSNQNSNGNINSHLLINNCDFKRIKMLLKNDYLGNKILMFDELHLFNHNQLNILLNLLDNRSRNNNYHGGKINLSINKSDESDQYIFSNNDFLFIATTNPCPCGNLYEKEIKCKCSLTMIKKYQRLITDAFLDRVDIQVDLNRTQFTEVETFSNDEINRFNTEFENSIQKVWEIQSRRNIIQNLWYFNSKVDFDYQLSLYKLNSKNLSLIKDITLKYRLNKRNQVKLINIARTIADLKNKPEIEDDHFIEALMYKKLTE